MYLSIELLEFNELINFLSQAPEYILLVIQILIILFIVFIIDRIATRYIRRFGRKFELVPDVINGLVLIVRFFIILAGLSAVMALGGIPSEIFISLSAIAGAAIGFASTRTIGNFISGLYVLVSRPFRIGDYVRIKDIEGIVKEITINYTKILTADGKIVLISNQEVLNSMITNYSRSDGTYMYSLNLSFDISLTKDEIEQIIETVIERFKDKVKDAKYSIVELTRLERKYRLLLIFDEAEDMFTIPYEFLSEITKEFDKLKAQKAQK